MKSEQLRVAIVGAGLGGLCLAQNLRRRGVRLAIYERDHSPWDRPQGYRLHIDADGVNAVHASLDPASYALFEQTAMQALPFTTIVGPDLSVRMRRSHDEHGGTLTVAQTRLPAHVNVNRATLREILLRGLDDCLHFDKKLIHYEERHDGVKLSFGDGTEVDADLLVGADGIHSLVRTQRAPQASLQDSAIRSIYGRIPLSRAQTFVPAQAREDVFTVALDDRKAFLGLGPVVFPVAPALLRLHAQEDYVVCIVGGRRELFQRDDRELRARKPSELQQDALAVIASWPAAARDIVANADPASFFYVEMFTSAPCTLGAPARVTLLGDAIHAMTPTLGRGANLALRDAALLAEHLQAYLDGRGDLAGALASYEAEMLPYDFDVVREAAAMGARLIGQEPLR